MNDVLNPPFGISDVEVLDRKFAYQGFLRVERLQLRCKRYEGGWSQPFVRETLLRHPGVGVLLYDPVADQVLLVEQFRVGCMHDADNGPWALELIAGLVDSEETETAVARRETTEEAGVAVGRLLPVCRYFNSPGGSNERMSVFCGRFNVAKFKNGVFGLPEENENIRTVTMPRSAALAAIQSGRINNAMSIIALQWLELNLAKVKATLLEDIEIGAES